MQPHIFDVANQMRGQHVYVDNGEPVQADFPGPADIPLGVASAPTTPTLR